MRFVVAVLALAATLASPLAASAGTVSEPTAVSLTVYNDDMALIREQRDFDLAGGMETVTLADVSGQINPATVHFSFVDGYNFTLLEQNFDFDLLSPDKLLQKVIGREITMLNKDGSQLTGKLLSVGGDGGNVVEAPDGRIMLNVPGSAVLPADAAAQLQLRPSLSWLIDSAPGGRHTGEVSYLSHGLSWNADYVLLLNADETAADIEGWVTLSNYSGTTYKDAMLKLVAGDVNVVADTNALVGALEESIADMEAPAQFLEQQFFEYHLYDLQRKTTIRNNEVKQVGLLAADAVPLKKSYLYEPYDRSGVVVQFDLTNDESSGLGLPLPAGIVRFFKRDSSGAEQYLSQDSIEHTPKDEKVTLTLGTAFNVIGETKELASRDLANGWIGDYRISLRNHKATAVVVDVPVRFDRYSQLLNTSLPFEMVNAYTAMFHVEVAADGYAELLYTIRQTTD